MGKNNDPQTQAERLLSAYGIRGALKAAEKNAKNAVSEAQEEFWERVAELVVEGCPDTAHAAYEGGMAGDQGGIAAAGRCPTCGDWL